MNPYRTSLLAVSLCLAVAGCIKLPDIEPDELDTEEPLPDLGVRLLTPGATTYTNGTVEMSVDVTNGEPETVELFVGGELLATLQGPYTFRWDTTTKPEGTYTLAAKARRGEQRFTSEAQTVVVDRTPPRVASRLPSPGAQNISVRQPIRVRFSEPLDPASLADTKVRLLMQIDGATVELAKALSLSEGGSELTITLRSKPNVPNELSIVMEGLADRAGNPMSNPEAWNWQYPAWLPIGGPLSRLPDGESAARSPAESPALTLDSQGHPVVAWFETPTTSTPFTEAHVFVQRWNGTSWEPIGDAASADWTVAFAGPPALELDGANRPVVAWYHIGGNDVFITRWEGHWQEIGRLSSGGMGTAVASKPSLQLDEAGNPLVLWAQDDRYSSFPPPTSDAYFGQWSGTEWLLTGRFSARTEQQTSVTGTVLKAGNGTQPVVAWTESDGAGNVDIYVGRLSVGNWTSIGNALSARPGATVALKPSLQLDAVGNPVVAWKEFNEGASSSNIYVQRWSGNLWEPLGNGVNADPAIAEVDDPVLALDGAGNPVVAWTGNDGNTTNIYVHRWANGQWVQLGSVLSANSGSTWAAHPSLRVDAEGVPIVAWDESADRPSSSQTRDVYVYRFNR